VKRLLKSIQFPVSDPLHQGYRETPKNVTEQTLCNANPIVGPELKQARRDRLREWMGSDHEVEDKWMAIEDGLRRPRLRPGSGRHAQQAFLRAVTGEKCERFERPVQALFGIANQLMLEQARRRRPTNCQRTGSRPRAGTPLSLAQSFVILR